MKDKGSVTIVDRLVINHTAFVGAVRQIQQCYDFSSGIAEPGAIAIVGESGTGKTWVLDNVWRKYLPQRDPKEGLSVPILFATVPPKPTIKSLAGAMLQGIGADDWERGTEYEKTKRLQVLIKGTGTKMVMIDEFQHFYDQDKDKMMYTVADWLKNLIGATKVALVVAGLPECTSVIQQNEQLRRRFLNPIRLPRLSWRDLKGRAEFRTILKEFHKEISKRYELPPLHSEAMAFRVYCATGGLMTCVASILRKAEMNATDSESKTISLEDLNVAHVQAIVSDAPPDERMRPFEESFSSMNPDIALSLADKVGKRIEQPKSVGKGPRVRREESLHSILRKR
jgi:Cdc6-like AAA superfamily ATPase